MNNARYSMHIQYTIPTRDAPHPFDQRSADVTLRTSDSVQFHVHTQILSQASPVFATMFELPQPLTTPDRQQSDDDAVSPVRPVVYVAEDSKALEPLLRLCYPVRKAELHHLDEIQPALEAAIKYDMEWPTEVLIPRLLECAAQGPLQVWAFGCRHGLEQVARRGAEALRAPPEAATTPVEASVIANRRAFKRLPFAHVEEISFIGCLSEDAPSSDVLCRCEDGTELEAHQSVLSLYSPVLNAQIKMMNAARASSQPPQPLTEHLTTALPVLNLEGICYHVRPQSDRPGRRSSDCIELLALATKYKIQPAVDLASAQWELLAPTHPHHSYFLARKTGMRGAAAVAATAALRCLWGPEAWATWCLAMMEDAPARTYHQLSVYVDACSRAALQAMEKTTKAWELTAAQRARKAGQPDAETAARMYQAVTDGLNRRREELTRREVAPKADHVRAVRWSSYSGAAGPPSLRNKFKDDLESLLESLPREIDDAINKVKLDLR
ncbi:hypothetical protein LXA43DRAFT_1132026 [Ganoderma leucocontextum]|nr:hypothetical protein LXA43DRAFT_1132026 [Ganoderma leucocontextum]